MNRRILTACAAAAAPAATALLLLFGAPTTARSQGGGVVNVDLGNISVSDVVGLNPSLYYRPFDDLGVRPSAAAMALGGAFLARASGPAAIGWSPASLAEMEHGELFVDGSLHSGSSQTSGYPVELTIPGAGSIFTTGYRVDPKSGARPSAAAGAMPIWRSGEMRLVGGLSWRRQYDVSYPEEIVNDFVFGGVTSFPVVLTRDRKERGGVEAIGPTFAFRISPQFAVGANLNALTGRWRATSAFDINVGAPVPPGGERLTYVYDGLSFDLGARFALGDKIAVAARFSPAHTLEVSGGAYHSESVAAPGQPQFIVDAKVVGYEMEIPSAFAIGGVVRPLPRLAVSADLTSRNWSETKLTYTGAGPDSPFALPLDLPLVDVASLHFGVEYVVWQPSWGEIPIRAGFRSSPLSFSDMDSTDVNPLDGDPVFAGDEIDTSAISAGFGVTTGNVTFDFGAERTSYEVQKIYFDSPGGILASGGNDFLTVDRSVTSMRFSATYRFGGGTP